MVEREEKIEPKEVEFQTLIDMLGYDVEHPPSRDGKVPLECYTRIDDKKVKYDIHAHIRYIKWVLSNNADKDLSNFIEINGPYTKKEFVEETNFEHSPEYEIIIKNLIIQTSNPCNPLKLEYNFGSVSIKFENNTFIATKSKNCYCNIRVGMPTYVTFNKNNFDKVDLFLGCMNNDQIFISLTNNTFNNRHITISSGGGPTKGYSSGGDLKSDIAGGIIGVEGINRMVNQPRDSEKSKLIEKIKKEPEKCGISHILQMLIYFDEKVNILPEHISLPPSTNIVKIIDNSFTKLKISGFSKFFFHGKNKINQIVFKGDKINIHWGPYQKLDKDGQYAHSHKQLFIALKARAIENQDKFQELIYQREIARCDWGILKDEKFLTSIQDWIVLCVGWAFSNHGVSWFRPIVWLLGINIAIALTYSHVTCSTESSWSTFWNAFWELLNPITNLTYENVENCEPHKNAISFINAFQKVILFGLTYEIIKVFRRFVAK